MRNTGNAALFHFLIVPDPVTGKFTFFTENNIKGQAGKGNG